MENQQKAYLYIYVLNKNGEYTEHKTEETMSYEDVFAFRRICKQYNFPHAVRFTPMTKLDRAHLINGKTVASPSKKQSFWTRLGW